MNWKELYPNKMAAHYKYHKGGDLPGNYNNDYWDWCEAGKNAFVIAPGLASLLAQTGVDDVPLSILKAPYSNFYVHVTFGHYVGFWVERHDDGSFHASYCLPDVTQFETGLDGFDGGCCIWPTDLIKGQWEKVADTVGEAKEYWQQANQVTIEQPEHIDLLVNILLYLSLPEKDIKEQWPDDVPGHLKAAVLKAHTRRKKEVARQAIQAAGYTKIKLVGQSFRHSAEQAGEGSAKAPHWRRGHWRNQAHGAGMAEHRLIWIQPTIINKEAGQPAKGHLYTTNL